MGYYADYVNGGTHGFEFQSGIFTPLNCIPYAINNKGQILGTLDQSAGVIFIDTNGSRVNLPVTFPPTSCFASRAITGFNNSDVITSQDFIYSNGVFTQIHIPGATQVNVNGAGDVLVGSYEEAPGLTRIR